MRKRVVITIEEEEYPELHRILTVDTQTAIIERVVTYQQFMKVINELNGAVSETEQALATIKAQISRLGNAVRTKED